MATLAEFIETASYCFVKKASLLSSIFKIGYSKYNNIIKEISVLGMYFWVLKRLGNNYALSEDEVNAILAHIVHICGRTSTELPDAASVISGSMIGGSTIGTTTDIPVIIYTMSYSGIEAFDVVVNHNLNKYSPTVIVTDTSSGSRIRVYPAIVENSTNQITLSFVSTSSGIITVL